MAVDLILIGKKDIHLINNNYFMQTQITSKLRETVEGTIWQVTKNIDLVYSQWDDEENGEGWYLQKYPGGICSQLFPSDYHALKALKDNKVTFDR